MKTIYIADPATGAGKTHAATDIAAEKSRFGVNTAFIMPTKRLINEAVRKLKERHPEIAQQVQVVVSTNTSGEKVSARIQEFLKTVGKDDGRILFITHEGFARVRHWHNRANWNVVLDEVLPAVCHEKFTLTRHRHVLLDLIHTELHDEKYSRVVGLDQWRVDEWAANNDDDMVMSLFSSLTSRIDQTSDWTMFVATEQFERFVTGQAAQLEIHGRLSPTIFSGFQTVTLMAAGLKESLLYRSFESYGCTFRPNNGILSRLRYRDHENGHRLNVVYLTERPWSKKLRHSTVMIGGEPMVLFDVLKQQIEDRFRHAKFLWIGNNDVDDDELSGVRLPNAPHGLDQYQNFDQCAIISALNASPAHAKFLTDQAGVDERQFRRSILSQVAYQALGRGSLRKPDATEHFTVIVPDRDTAEDIASFYPGCTIERLLDFDPVPDAKPRGRPKIHTSSAGRQAAYRERISAQNAINEICYENTIYIKGFRNAGFCFTPFRSRRDAVGGSATYCMALADFYNLLCRAADNEFADKHANHLFAPTIFEKGRRKEDALAHLGLVLDLDHTHVPVEKVADVFPDLIYIAYSSASHQPDDWCYRLCFPTISYMTPENALLLRQTLISRFEQAGYAPDKHGVDRSKLNAAALFYWPMKTDHGFVRLVDGGERRPLDPLEWLRDAPVPEDTFSQPSIPCSNSTVIERRKAGAVAAFLRKGTTKGKGRAHFYGLGMNLGLIGCDGPEIVETLTEMAAFTTNPPERRSEIAGIMKAVTGIPSR